MAKVASFSTTRSAAGISPASLRAPGRKSKRQGRPFMGVDGEGCGRDRHGRQHYMLLRAGPYECYTGKPLTTFDCLDFILGLPDTHILVGFAFGYDVTQILRDLPKSRLERLFADKPVGLDPATGKGVSRYTNWNDYAIEYLPRNYLRIARLRRRTVEDPKTGLPKLEYYREEDSARTIWETFGFFQCSFLKAIQNFDIGRLYWPEIERNKKKRSKFVRITKPIRRYCELECALLASMMEKFRSVCHAAGIHPTQWAGAGKLAAYLHRAHGTISGAALTDRLLSLRATDVLKMANDAYYGGRFEITRIGDIGPCFEYDINSAYPAAMLSLPCLEHGTWQRVTPLWLANAPPAALFVAEVHFSHPEDNALCGLPVRHKQGHLCWPREGVGTYWSPELCSAEKLGATFEYKRGWRYVSHCQCQPFAWVEELYQERLRLGKTTAGYPIKLGTNSLYGKLAQRIGNPRYGNFIWAGLITAITRATLNDAIALDPSAVVMIATDAIVSKTPLPLPSGKALGEWDPQSFDNLFIVQPGLYWEGHRAGQKRKTRGTSTSIFARHMHRFEKKWRRWCAGFDSSDLDPVRLPSGKWRRNVPVVSIKLTLFIGLRLANARNDLLSAGKWDRVAKQFDFEWGRKRSMAPIIWEGASCVRTLPLPGGPDFVSCPHNANAARQAELDREKMEYEDQPELLDRSMP